MPSDFARKFYGSVQWQKCREAYMKQAGGLCEECLKHGRITAAVHVHHIKPLKPYNINDPKITTNFANLMALCESCHEAMHDKLMENNTHGGRYRVRADGSVELL